jgi:hypothetical protein
VLSAAQCAGAASTILVGTGDAGVLPEAREGRTCTCGQCSKALGEVGHSSLVSSRGFHNKWEGGITEVSAHFW